MTGDRGRELSMDDILSSIRLIINKADEAPAVAPSPPLTPDPQPAEPVDILELTEPAPPASRPAMTHGDPAGGQTLDALTRSLLEPMLRSWLDANLPRIVEAAVSREVRRLAGGG